LQHSFDSHAAQWFARHGGTLSTAKWQELIETASKSTKVVDWSIVDAEIIRPRSWILASGLCAGRMLPLNLPELDVSGLALVTAIDDCPPIAGGEGSVVTARFVTREVHVVASVDVLGADGTVETITGTTIHPVWSVDRQEWVPLAELAEGETLQGLDGLAVVLGVSLSRVSQPVYNIEVHGEHVYQVGELGLVVHNSSANQSGLFTRARRFFYDNRNFRREISPEYGSARGGANGHSLHHWLFPQRAGIPQGIQNAGFNLINLPPMRSVFHRSLDVNTWMGWARNWGPQHAARAAWVENGIRVGIPALCTGTAYVGYEVGGELWELLNGREDQ
jgi:hypothetical protein